VLILKIAFRNIFRQKRRTILTVLTMFGGFALAAVSIAWSDGTYAHVINMFTRNQLGHIQIHRKGYLDRPSIYKTINDYRTLGRALDTLPDIENWAPRLYSAGLASVGDNSSAASIIGIDPGKEEQATHFSKKITSGRTFSSNSASEAIVGKGLAIVLGASVDDSVVIVSQAADGSIANDIYRIVGVFSSDEQLSERSNLYLPLGTAQTLFVLEGRVHEIAVVCRHLDEVDETAALIRSVIQQDNLAVATWKQFAKSFYQAMQADQQGAWIMLFVILLVVAVGVLNTVLMTVLERRREYGVLRAVGTAPGEIFRLVIYEVLIMAGISLILGAIIAYVVNYLLSVQGLPMPEAFTYGGITFSRMYTEVNAHSFYIPAICVILTAIVVSLFPAGKAARIEPAKAMRIH
jgi:ABC-type lipoprotein release transport system permease subunit